MQQHPNPPKPAAALQSSIRSFFQPRTPNYAPPPGSTNPTKSPKLPSNNPSTPAASTNPRPSLPPQATISAIEDHHVQPLRRINSLLLPISYPDNFYHRLLAPGESQPIFSRIILWQDSPSKGTPSDAGPKVVGGIVCRIDANDPSSETSSIYIQSLALLSPYRSYGLASTVLEDIIAHATSNVFVDGSVTSLYAHVWTQNEEALEWYAKRGFTREEPVLHGYYRRLKPDTAWVVRRQLRPSDHLRNTGTGTTTAAVTVPQLQTHSSAPPPSQRPNPTPGLRAASYQSMRPATEWNDLPSDILVPSSSTTPSLRPSPAASLSNLLEPPLSAKGEISTSQPRNGIAKDKKKRQYPAAAFGATTS